MKKAALYLGLVGCLLLVGLLPEGQAGSPVFPASLKVLSTYQDPLLKTWGTPVTWGVAFSNASDGSGGYVMGATRQGDQSPTIRVFCGADGKPLARDRYTLKGGRTVKLSEDLSGDLILSEGFPVPYDYLAPSESEMKKAGIRKEAGGTVFAYQVDREVTDFSLQQALSAGMIRDEIRKLVGEKPLRMITVTKDGDLLVRQLWAEGLTWWVYEETSQRRSWLLGIE